MVTQPTNVFDQIITQGVRAGQIPARTEQARAWYRDAAKEFGRVNERALLQSDKQRLTTKIYPGNMYMYLYSPKTQDELPYYDRFPLVFPFRVLPDRFWGINLHYLHPRFRAKLMDALYDLTNNKRYDESTRLKLSYSILSRAARLRYFKPCVKQYLKEYRRSNFLYVYPSEWDIALFLPTERFVGTSKAIVWDDSKQIIGGR
jgi:hypothetical protein